MLIKILVGIVVVIGAVFVIAAFRSPEYTVSRSIVIKATPEILFPYINSAEKSYTWMPWKDMDSQIQMSYAGPLEGVGSKGSWTSPGQMGTGSSVIIESVTNKMTKIQIDYVKPFVMNQISEMSVEPTADGTTVKWSVTGSNNLMFRVVGLFMNMDKMVGGNFELGLGKLKTLVETK